MRLNRNGLAAIGLVVLFGALWFGLWTMERYPLADGNDPLLLSLAPIGAIAGAWLSWKHRDGAMAWLFEEAPLRITLGGSALIGGVLLFALGNTINGAFASDETTEVKGKVVFFCCANDDEPSVRLVPDSGPRREISITVTPGDYLHLREKGRPVMVHIRRGALGRDLVARYEVVPVPNP